MVKELPPLLADAMLGRLSRWLRLLGYDTLYASSMSDHQIVARARAEGRVVLTRDRDLAQRKGIRCLLIQGQALEEQVSVVFNVLGEPSPGVQPRCPRCNTALAEVSPDQVRPFVPAHVFHTYSRFHHCPTCDKYYWPGSHWENVRLTIQRIRQDADRS